MRASESRRILLVDDHAAVRHGLALVLTEEGVGECREAAGREEVPCDGEPRCAGMKATEEGTIVWRAYLDPTAKTGPDPAEVILDKAIKFNPKR